MIPSFIGLAFLEDESIIAEAAVPYKDTDDGKGSFDRLKPYIRDLLKYHRVP